MHLVGEYLSAAYQTECGQAKSRAKGQVPTTEVGFITLGNRSIDDADAFLGRRTEDNFGKFTSMRRAPSVGPMDPAGQWQGAPCPRPRTAWHAALCGPCTQIYGAVGTWHPVKAPVRADLLLGQHNNGKP
jgi:hypothetical protein